MTLGDTLTFSSDTLEIVITPGSANVNIELIETPTGRAGATGETGPTG